MGSFKTRLARGEVDVHHHHAEYKPVVDPEDDEGLTGHSPANADGHNHSHNHGHGHGHGHSHGVYKHIGHPNGPRTMIDQGVCCCFMGQFPDHIVEEQRAALALAETDK